MEDEEGQEDDADAAAGVEVLGEADGDAGQDCAAAPAFAPAPDEGSQHQRNPECVPDIVQADARPVYVIMIGGHDSGRKQSRPPVMKDRHHSIRHQNGQRPGQRARQPQAEDRGSAYGH